MNAIERLREYAEATRWGGVCRVLHAYHGDFAGDCLERECGECRAAYLRMIVDEIERDRTDSPKVLDADGVEIKVGDTVRSIGGTEEYEAVSVSAEKVVLEYFDAHGLCGHLVASPDDLTHEQPDSWQRIEDDAKKNACEVFHPGEEECDGCRFEGKGNCEEELRLELVKRCKALAERS